MKHLLIIGARGWGREVYAGAIGTKAYRDGEYDVKGFLDSKADAFEGLKGNYPPIICAPEDYEIQPDDVENCVMKGEPLNLRVNLNGLADGGEYIIKTRSISRQHGSILDEWKRLRCESQLERADIKYLQGVCVPHMSMERKSAQGDRLTIPIRLEAQEFCLFHIYRSS